MSHRDVAVDAGDVVGAGGITAAAPLVDEAVLRGDGTGGAQASLAFINDTGNMSIRGTERTIPLAGATLATHLQVHDEVAADVTQANVKWSTGAGSGALMVMARSRGTKAAPTVVANADVLGTVIFAGHDGTDFAVGAQIAATVDSTPGSNDMPTKLVLAVTPDGSQTPGAALTINSDKSVTYGTTAALPATAGTTSYDGKVFYAATEASNPGLMPVEYFICLAATNTLTDSTSEQPLLDQTGNGALTLPVGTYHLEGFFSISAMSATSGNLGFSLAGTATLGSILIHLDGSDGAVGGIAANTSFTMTSATAAAPIVSATTATAVQIRLQGTLRVTVTGTVIPSVALQTGGVTPVVAVGSYFRFKCLGATAVQAVGQWS
jgi:hypothetical protein